MKVLLVRIQNYENESLENEIKTFFEQKGCELFVESYDLQNLEKIPLKLLELSNSVDYMIGVGLAGFFVLAETNSNSKIVVNPCMTPSALPDLAADYQKSLRKLEEKTYSMADAEMRVVTYGIFTKEVDEQDKELFVRIYGRDMCGMNNYCIKENLIGQQNLKFRIEESTKYFEHICSLNY